MVWKFKAKLLSHCYSPHCFSYSCVRVKCTTNESKHLLTWLGLSQWAPAMGWKSGNLIILSAQVYPDNIFLRAVRGLFHSKKYLKLQNCVTLKVFLNIIKILTSVEDLMFNNAFLYSFNEYLLNIYQPGF